jgi:hypothetical protein
MITRYVVATGPTQARALLNMHLLRASDGGEEPEAGSRVHEDEQGARNALRELREDSDSAWSWDARVWVVQFHTQQLPD